MLSDDRGVKHFRLISRKSTRHLRQTAARDHSRAEHLMHEFSAEGDALRAAVPHAELCQHIVKAHDAEADVAVAERHLLLDWKRVVVLVFVDDPVESADTHGNRAPESIEVE